MTVIELLPLATIILGINRGSAINPNPSSLAATRLTARARKLRSV
jgi:hypothetical protein